MILTVEQQRWCAEHGLGLGYDDDNPLLVQHKHVVETTGEKPCTDAPHETYEVFEALCRSPRLWFGQGRGFVWPALDHDQHLWAWFAKPSPEQVAKWSEITCEHCERILIDRGCPAP